MRCAMWRWKKKNSLCLKTDTNFRPKSYGACNFEKPIIHNNTYPDGDELYGFICLSCPVVSAARPVVYYNILKPLYAYLRVNKFHMTCFEYNYY